MTSGKWKFVASTEKRGPSVLTVGPWRLSMDANWQLETHI